MVIYLYTLQAYSNNVISLLIATTINECINF